MNVDVPEPYHLKIVGHPVYQWPTVSQVLRGEIRDLSKDLEHLLFDPDDLLIFLEGLTYSISDQHQNDIMQNYNDLVKVVDPTQILDLMMSVIGGRREAIDVKTRGDQMRAILDVAVRSQPDYYMFLRALCIVKLPRLQKELKSYIKSVKELHEKDIKKESEESLLGSISMYAPLTVVLDADSTVIKEEGYTILEEEKDKRHQFLHIQPHDLFDKIGSEEAPRTILIRGRGGIGKSTFLRKLIKDWADGTIWRDTFKVVYRFQMKFLSNVKNRQLKCQELFQSYHGPVLNDEAKRTSWAYIQEHDEEILITFDGLDECDILDTLSKPHKLYSYDQEADIADIIYSIQCGSLLPKAKVLFASRPVSPALEILDKFDRVAEVHGFDDDQRKQFIVMNCGDSAEQILRQLKEDTMARSLCAIPVICTLYCRVFKLLQRAMSRPAQHEASTTTGPAWHEAPRTMTQMLSLLLLFFTSEHHGTLKGTVACSIWHMLGRVTPTLRKLAELAYRGITSTPLKLMFNYDDIKECGIEQDDINCGLLTSQTLQKHPLLRFTNYMYQFLHRLFQEYLAALHMVTLPWEEIEKMVCDGNKQLEMTIVYLGGLLGNAELHDMVAVIYPRLKNTTTQLSENCSKLLSIISSFKGNSKGYLAKRKKVNSLLIVHETQQSKFMDDVTGVTRGGSVYMKRADMTSIECKGLAFIMRDHEGPITNINISNNPFGDEGLLVLKAPLTAHAKHLTKLNLHRCRLGASSLKVLCDSLAEGGECLEVLIWQVNPALCSGGVDCLVQKLLPKCKSLVQLALAWTGLQEQDALDVARAVGRHCANMESLEFYGNNLSVTVCDRLEADYPNWIAV